MLTHQLSNQATAFVHSVLQFAPRLAVFDCDGTLWSGDAGERFFDWELRRGVVPDEIARWARARYAEYRDGRVSEEDMCGEMVTLHRGLKEENVQALATEFIEENFVKQFFPEMQQLILDLQHAACDVWAVSSSNVWIIRAAMRHFDIPQDHILASEVEIDNGVVTDRLIRVPSGLGKPRAIRKVIQRDPDAAFGNSRWDVEMFKVAAHPFVVNPNPDLEQLANDEGWPVYWPDSLRSQVGR
jgi:HAD superfamily phosphoserine phosphatase-like hydrolase